MKIRILCGPFQPLDEAVAEQLDETWCDFLTKKIYKAYASLPCSGEYRTVEIDTETNTCRLIPTID